MAGRLLRRYMEVTSTQLLARREHRRGAAERLSSVFRLGLERVNQVFDSSKGIHGPSQTSLTERIRERGEVRELWRFDHVIVHAGLA